MTHILLILQMTSTNITSWSTVGEFSSQAACVAAGSLLVFSNKETTVNYACLSKELELTAK